VNIIAKNRENRPKDGEKITPDDMRATIDEIGAFLKTAFT
jgi:hypothetical protein